jgi:RNA polymerase primary sigma factor
MLAKEALLDGLANLGYRERRVIELRYGLAGERPRTLDEIGRTFNVTRERIRQIETSR